jgi:hypothetical protein
MSQRRSAFLHAFALVAVTASSAPAGAVDECRANPDKPVSPGEHWFYRHDGANKRRCWYVGQKRDWLARTSKSDASRSAPTTIKPSISPATSRPPPVSSTPATEVMQGTNEMPSQSKAPVSTEEQQQPSRSSVLPRWPEATADPIVSAAPAQTVAMGSQVTAPADALPKPEVESSRAVQRSGLLSIQSDLPAAESESPDTIRGLLALLLAALAALMIIKPVSEFVRGRRDCRPSDNDGRQAPTAAISEPRGLVRKILDRCGHPAGSRHEPHRDSSVRPYEIARALQEFADAAEAYRNGKRKRVRASDSRLRVMG